VTALLVLASELTEKTLWNPTIVGVLVVVSGIVLFCGSVYLLLATNVGARLGFLIAAAGLTGLMVLLSLVWLTTATPLNSPRGRLPVWKAVEVVDDYRDSSVGAVRTIADGGELVDEADYGDIRPAVDAALVLPSAGGEQAGEPSEFAFAQNASDVIIVESYTTGGDTRFLFWHEPRYQTVQFCQDDKSDNPPPESLEVAPPPRCDPAIGNRVVVFQRDLGSLRQPPFLFFVAFSVLFTLSLLGLYWRERDEREAARAAPAS
jgi:hypothetical protein